VDISKLIVIRPLTGEEAFEATEILIKEKADVVVIDSFASLLPNQEAEEEEISPTIGLQARLLSQGLRRLVPINDNTVVVATNQMRQDIGTGYHRGIQERMSGGVAQYFYASLIVKVSRRGDITIPIGGDSTVVEVGEDGSEDTNRKNRRKVGFMLECLVTKCNYAPPFQSCQVPFNFYTGQLDNVASMVDLAISLNVIERKGAWYQYKGEKFQGRQGVIDWVKEDPTRIEEIKSVVL
jgi:recombination protein RecA